MAHQEIPEATIYDKAIPYNEPIPYNGELLEEEAHKRPPRLFTFVDKTNWIRQPNFVRQRAVLRGPRNSYKINLEMSQFYYDINRLWKRLNQSKIVLSDYLEDILNGETIELTEYNWFGDATPSDEPMYITSWNDMVDKVQQMRERVRALERNSNG